MIKAAGDAATKGGTGDGTSIGDADNTQGAKADAASVKEIAKGIKGIVEAAGKAEGEKGDALKGVGDGGDGTANKDAGKLFRTQGGATTAGDVEKAATAVSAVSGKQILKAIVDAAAGDQAGAQANAAKNPIAAAIGADNDNGAAFTGEMQKNDKIAAAIVLRGLAKGG
ncbi:variable large family protein, partial [Borreliella garinii]|uniref:variable large family protein n=1 Tax=Borreliella garinii TaxID=29519 RepID=UPI001F278981